MAKIVKLHRAAPIHADSYSRITTARVPLWAIVLTCTACLILALPMLILEWWRK